MAASAAIVIYGVRYGFARIRFVYWVLIGLLALHVTFGIIANQVQVGTVLIGGRMYLRTIPFFLLALAIPPNEATLKKHFLIILGIAMLQLPVAVYQKVSNYQRALTEGYITMTGDWVIGTLGGPGYLSIFLILFSAVVMSLYARKKVSTLVTVVIVLVALAPTMINETKVTFFLAPIALAVPLLVFARENRLKNAVKTLIFALGFLAIFIPAYDYFVMPRWGYGLIDFFMMEGRLEGYLSKGAEVGTTGPVGRMDSITVAMQIARQDISTAMFGLGMGNVTESTFGARYAGAWFPTYGKFVGTTYARLFFEIGFVGAALVLTLLYLVWSDARRLFRQDDAYGVVGHAYLAILPILLVVMIYADLLRSPGISACFWYYCGVIAAASKRSAELSPEPATPRVLSETGPIQSPLPRS